MMSRLVRSVAHLGAAPRVEGSHVMDMTPVDYAVRALVEGGLRGDHAALKVAPARARPRSRPAGGPARR
jgi:hypothetical protein